MYRVAARILREVGRQDDAEDAVMAAIESLMKAPPSNVANWEAMMVHATKMRALDLLSSAAFRHSASEDVTNFDGPASACVEDDVVELVDRQRAAATAWDKLSVLDDRHRKVAWDYVAMERPRGGGGGVRAAGGSTGSELRPPLGTSSLFLMTATGKWHGITSQWSAPAGKW